MYAFVQSIAHSFKPQFTRDKLTGRTHKLSHVSINNYETNLSPYIKIQVYLYVVRPGTSK